MKTTVNLDLFVQNCTELSDVPSDEDFNHWISAALEGHTAAAEITVRIVDETEITQLNRTYRDKNKPTNILSFPYDTSPDGALHGDMVICASVMQQEALEQGLEIKAHWAHLTIHGCYHLLGHDHQSDAETKVMQQLEIKCLQQLGFENPYKIEEFHGND